MDGAEAHKCLVWCFSQAELTSNTVTSFTLCCSYTRIAFFSPFMPLSWTIILLICSHRIANRKSHTSRNRPVLLKHHAHAHIHTHAPSHKPHTPAPTYTPTHLHLHPHTTLTHLCLHPHNPHTPKPTPSHRCGACTSTCSPSSSPPVTVLPAIAPSVHSDCRPPSACPEGMDRAPQTLATAHTLATACIHTHTHTDTHTSIFFFFFTPCPLRTLGRI